nr:DNA gyrase inhibitor YacG [Neoroseomonas alba]
MPRCPICRRPAQEAARPFCSARCAQVDLGRWMTESYAIPAAPADDEEER